MTDTTQLPSFVKAPSRLHRPGEAWASYQEIIPSGVPLSALLSIEYWKRVQDVLRPFDVIRCCAQDGAYDADLRVMTKSAGSMTLAVVREWTGTGGKLLQRESVEGKYSIKQQHRGQDFGWSVRETETGKVLADGLDRPGAEAERNRLVELAGG